MTTLLKSIIAHYKETGSRVDEVLFQEVMKIIERTQKLELLLQGNDGMSVKEIRQQFVDLHQSSLHLENKIESAEAVLKFYAANATYALQINKGEQFYTDIENDRGRRAQMYLRRESHASGKDKGSAKNRGYK